MNEATAKLLEKASRAIRSAERALEDGDYEAAADRPYCAMFSVADAPLNERAVHFKRPA